MSAFNKNEQKAENGRLAAWLHKLSRILGLYPSEEDEESDFSQEPEEETEAASELAEWLLNHLRNDCGGECPDHEWDGCACKKCGAENEEGHIFSPDRCVCERCGKPNPDEAAHIWDGCACTRCGVINHDWYWEERRDRRNRGHYTMVCARCGARGLGWSM